MYLESPLRNFGKENPKGQFWIRAAPLAALCAARRRVCHTRAPRAQTGTKTNGYENDSHRRAKERVDLLEEMGYMLANQARDKADLLRVAPYGFHFLHTTVFEPFRTFFGSFSDPFGSFRIISDHVLSDSVSECFSIVFG